MLDNFLLYIQRYTRRYKFKGSGRINKYVNKILLSKVKTPITIKLDLGIRLRIEPYLDNVIDTRLMLNGVYERGTIYFMQNFLSKNDIFIDAGANIGLMTCYASKLVGDKGTVHSFEPHPKTFEKLTENCLLNKCKNTTILNYGLGSSIEYKEIYNLPQIRGAASFVRKGGMVLENNDKQKIIDLDSYLVNIKHPSIKMLKVDVEGWELEVLKGAKKLLSGNEAPIIIIEYSTTHPPYKGELTDIYNFILDVNNYSIFKFENGKENISKLIEIKSVSDLPIHDNLFCLLKSVLPKYQYILEGMT
ncbi:MAG: FkbM family methyltransferase [Chloroflexia bacterium]|nr:FkbM family methyltransferase [Chloroflexia bacterium]